MMLTLSDDEGGLGRMRAVPLNEAMSQLCPRPGRPHVFEMRSTSSSAKATAAAAGGAGGLPPLCVLDAGPDGDAKYAWIEALSGAAKQEVGQHTLDTVAGCLAVLGLDADASSLAELKRAYYRLALAHHPDRGGDPAVFARVTEANHVLRSVRERERQQERGVLPGGAGGWRRVAVTLERTAAGIGLELEDVGAAPLNNVTVSGFLSGSVAEGQSEAAVRARRRNTDTRRGRAEQVASSSSSSAAVIGEEWLTDGEGAWVAKGDIIAAVDGTDVRGLPLDGVFKQFVAGSRAGKPTAELEFLRRVPADDAASPAAAEAAANEGAAAAAPVAASSLTSALSGDDDLTESDDEEDEKELQSAASGRRTRSQQQHELNT